MDAVIFDKDGTLFDFRQSWGAWTRSVLRDLGQGPDHAARLARVLGYDPQADLFDPGSPVIAATTDEIAAILAAERPDLGAPGVAEVLNDLAAGTPMVPAVDLRAVLGALKARGLRLGLATNDTETPARTHLAAAGVLELFDFVAGCDSGWGGKPAPGQLLAFASRTGLDPSRIAMVGDSRHDLEAGRRAGMARVAVLTGIALANELAPHADVVLPDIGHLAAWIDSRRA